MDHRCLIEDSSVYCFELNGQLWISDYNNEMRSPGRSYIVKFCPECGFKLPEKFFDSKFGPLSNIPAAETDNRITEFSYQLAKAISEMNHNIAIIKRFMSSQNTQNEGFIERDIYTSKEIDNLKRTIEILDERINDLVKEALERIGL